MNPEPMTAGTVLEGIRVVELGRILAAPHCGLLFAALGADVVKIERPGGGDETRENPGFYESGMSAYFVQQNWGKRSVALDIADADGQLVLRRLLETADVFIENLRPGAIGRLGFDWPAVHEINPRLVMCSISGYGQTGPESSSPGYGALAEARTGISEMTGEPTGPPMGSTIPIADMTAASRAFGLICAALVERARTNTGRHIDVSLIDVCLEMHDWAVERAVTSSGGPVRRRGLRDDVLIPWGQFETADGWLVLLANSDAFWPRLTTAIDRSDLGADPRLRTNHGRQEHRDYVYDAIESWARGRATKDAVDKLKSAGVPAESLATIADVLDDPIMLTRRMVATLPSAGDRPVLATATYFASTEHRVARDAPLLGADTSEVLAEVGISPEEICGLLQQGVVEGPEEAEPLGRAHE